MGYFAKLNKAWQDGINAQIQDCDGGERPEVATAFCEGYAHHLSECKIARKPTKADLEDIQSSYIEFTNGWEAAVNNLSKDQMGLIASWVRGHGEFTDYSGLDVNEEYEAYIVKASDLIV